MSNETKLSAQVREVTGSTASRRLRREGLLPAAVNDAAGKTTLLQLSAQEFKVMQMHHHSESLVLALDIEGRGLTNVQMLEVQHHNITGNPVHVDFAEISMSETMTANVTIALTGEATGVKMGGGMLDQQLHELEVTCLPGDLVDEVFADVSSLDVGDSIYVKDLDLGGKMVATGDVDQVIAHVVPPHAEEEEDVEAAGSDEPEVIGETKAEKE